MENEKVEVIEPQKGFQEMFMSSSADVVIAGSGAGVGKSFAMLMESLRNVHNPHYNGVIFRRTMAQVVNGGGLWDDSHELYPLLGGISRISSKDWTFPSGAKIKFGHLEHEKNVKDHQGGQYGFLGFDELTHFTEKMFFYLLSRNRSRYTKAYCRATTNPDPDHWVASFIAWYLDKDTGLPIPERNGAVRYFTRIGDDTIWGDSKQEVLEKAPQLLVYAKGKVKPDDLIYSFAFIAGSIYDNKKLLDNDPSYIGRLLSQSEADKASLLDGSWKATENNNQLFNNADLAELEHIEPMPEIGEQEEKDDRPKQGGKLTGYCSADVARFGSDWAVNITWRGLNVEKINILTKCDTSEFVDLIEADRNEYGIMKQNCIVDADGLGAGVVDFGKYKPFANGIAPIQPPKAKNEKGFVANYPNLKTQVYYKLAECIRDGRISLKNTRYFVNGRETSIVSVKGTGDTTILSLLKRQLRAIRRVKADMDGKLQINNKANQKELLNGMSPDLVDALAYRCYFLLEGAPQVRKAYMRAIG